VPVGGFGRGGSGPSGAGVIWRENPVGIQCPADSNHSASLPNENLATGSGTTGTEWTPPVSLVALAAWFEPSLSTCFTNAAGTTPVTADGDTVQSIRTANGNLIGGNSFSGTYPVYRTGSGKPYLDFTGGDQLQGGGNYQQTDKGGQWTAAAAIVPLGTDNQVILNGIGTAVEIVSGDLGGRAVSGGGSFNYRDTSGATTVANTNYVVQTLVSATTVESSLNGVSDGPGTITNTPPDSSLSSFAIGNYSAGVSGFKLYGFVWYQGALSSADQVSLSTYLAALFPASGTTYNDTLSESATSADSLANVATFSPALAESGTATDSLSPAGSTFGVPLSEALTSATTYGSAATFASTLSEGLTASDSNVGGLLLSATLNEALTGSDSAATTMTFGPSLSEAATAAASLATQAVFGSAVSEGLTAADAPSNLGTFPNAMSEALAANDNLATTATFPNSLSETGTLNAVFSTGATTYNDTLTEGLTASAALSGGLFLVAALSEAATATASQSSIAMFGATLGEALTSAEGTAAAVTMPAALSEAASLSSALSAGLTILAQRSEASIVSDALAGSAGLFAAVLEQASAGDSILAALLIDGGLDESIAANDELLGFIGEPPSVPDNRTSHAEPVLAGTAASAMASTSAEPGLRTTYAPKRAA